MIVTGNTTQHCHLSVNQSINQSINQSTNQSVNQSTIQPINAFIEQIDGRHSARKIRRNSEIRREVDNPTSLIITDGVAAIFTPIFVGVGCQ